MSSGNTLATEQSDPSGVIAANLPFLRRYARALTGSQTSGDHYAAATLEAILVDQADYPANIHPRVALFRAFHMIWSSAGAPIAEDDSTGPEQRAQMHMRGLTKDTREALLLHTIEGFDLPELGQVLQTSAAEASELVQKARFEMEKSMRGSVMIIEDEALVAMDIENIVTEMGHRVTGIARTHSEAVRLGAKESPDLILADIKLADHSSGIDAVRELLAMLGDVPVIFITGSPELLLTGARSEPAFLIRKPYVEEQVRSAVSQAMFFASTEMLESVPQV